MTKILNDIKNKRHDTEICISNCKENGKAFNQKSYRCQYYTGYSKYKSLLEYQEIQSGDETDGLTVHPPPSPKIREFCFQLILLEDFKEEVGIGCRKQEDVIGVEETVGKL